MTPPRVLALYSTLAVGGAERQLEILARGLRTRDFELVVATLRHRGKYFESLRDSGFVTAHANMQSRTDIAGAVRGYRLWRNRPALVLTQSVNAHVIGHAHRPTCRRGTRCSRAEAREPTSARNNAA